MRRPPPSRGSASSRISAAAVRRGSRVSPQPRKTPKRKSAGRPLLRGALRVLALASFWGFLALAATILFFVSRLPDPVLLTLDDRPPNLTILAADGTVLAERGLRRGHVRLDRLPPYLPQAVIATEDRRFYSHGGVDSVGVLRAAGGNDLFRPTSRLAGRLDHHPADRPHPVSQPRTDAAPASCKKWGAYATAHRT